MTAYRQYLANAEGEPLGYETIWDDAPELEDFGPWDEYDPDTDPNHSCYSDMDFDTNHLDTKGNVIKDCSWHNIPVYGPWEETYYDGSLDW